jgi:hypothetical protein
MLGSELAFGAYYFASRKDEAGTQGKFDLEFYGVEGTFHFEGEAKGAYFGGRLGLSKMAYGLEPNQVSASPFHIGVIGGYNYWLAKSLSIGGEIGLYSVTKAEATSLSGTTVAVDRFSVLNFLATIKLWL